MKKPKMKKLKVPKTMRNLLKTGKVSTGAFKKLRGAQISIKAPRGGVGAGMAGK